MPSSDDRTPEEGPDARERLIWDRQGRRCDVDPEAIARALREIIGSRAELPVWEEAAAWSRRAPPRRILDVDTGAWLAFCLRGLLLFSGGFPTLRRLKLETRRVVLEVAMERAKGSITGAAEMVGTSRKVLRDNLRALGLYPWRGIEVEGG